MLKLKIQEEIEIMRKNGEILSGIMQKLKKGVKPGIKTRLLDELAKKFLERARAKPSFLGFEGYPALLCTSLNEEIVHCLPSERELKEGDILSLDLGIYKDGFHVDMAVTVPVGKVSFEAQRLIKVTKKALRLAIKKTKEGNTFGDIGNTIERYVKSQGFNVIRDLCGHGIGRELHEPPQILNFGKRHKGLKIKEGMVFCIEPMVSSGDWHIKKSKDGFGYETKDGSLSCHFEHTLAVTEKGTEILTSPSLIYNDYDR